MKKLFTVTEVNGSKRSTNAEYSHALIGNYDWDARITLDAKIQDWQKCNFDYAVKCASVKAGDIYPGGGFSVDQTMIDSANETLSKYPTLPLYLQGLADERVTKAKKYKEENGSPVTVLCWASRYELAYNRIGEFQSQNYINLKVVPTVRVK